MNVGKESMDRPDLIPEDREMLLPIAKFVGGIKRRRNSPSGENVLGCDYICAA